MADRYKGPIPKPKRMLKEFDRKRALSSGPSLKGPNAKYKKTRNIDPNFIMKRQPKIMDPNFEMKREPKNIDPNFIMKDKGFDFPMSREGSPTVTDTETGETTYGRPKDFKNGGINIHHFASDVDNKKLSNKQLAEKAKILFDQRNKQADTKEKFKKIKEEREKEMREYNYKRKKPLIDEIAKRRTATEGSFKKGGMMECRGGGIAITGKKFQGVF